MASGTASEWCTGSLLDAAAAIRDGRLSPVALTEAMLARIKAHDAKLNAYVTVMAEQALTAATVAEHEIGAGRYRGLLHGIPVGVKDLVDTAGVRTTCASKVFADNVPTRDATVVTQLKSAGAVILGKLNMTEFALYGYHPGNKVPVNPWSPTHWPGVSSSGSGAATAASLCFAAVASDTGGSIRIPAAACGVVGVKPTFGKVSRHGCFPLADTLDHIGPMARRVGDAAAMLAAMEGHDPEDATTRTDMQVDYVGHLAGGDVVGLRIGIDVRYNATDADPQVVSAVDKAVAMLAGLGATIVPIDLTGIMESCPFWFPRVGVDALHTHRRWFDARPDDYGPAFRALLDYGRTVGADVYAQSQVVAQRVTAIIDHALAQVDLIACPSAATPPVAIADFPPLTVVAPQDVAGLVGFQAPFDFSGHPTLSVPCGFTDAGLPLSLQLIAGHGDEATLFRAGHVYEAAAGWYDRHPNLAAL